MSDPPNDIDALIDTLRKGTDHLRAMASSMEFPWNPDLDDPRKLHNMYARNLICAYVSKWSDLSTGILHAIEHSHFLTYALCGRALIETTAMLRYYVLQEYKPLLDKGSLNAEDKRKLIEIDDRHLRGSRFDWQSFLYRRYAKLKADAVAHLNSKKQKNRTISEAITAQQVNVVTCVEKWAGETPEILIAYHLFCDLVHPNIGSNLLVASATDSQFYFSRFRGEPVGREIFNQSFPVLLSATRKPFGEYLTLLMGTIWHDDEL